MRTIRRIKKGTIFMTLGLLLIAAALCLTVYNIWDENRAAASVDTVMTQFVQKAEEMEPWAADEDSQDVPGRGMPADYERFPDMEMPTVKIDGNDYIGTLEIPCLDLSLPIISQWSYPNLKIAPCRFEGSAYQDNLVLAGHNYRRHFSGIKSLQPGDRVLFTDVDGNRFPYDVSETEVLDPTSIEEMVTNDDWDLTLFTCTYGGQTRFVVRCQRCE